MFSEMPDRRRVPSDTETAVLAKSARRCCLCFHLRHDFNEKLGQIAHLDHDPSNSSEDNLAFLCMEHHSLYDSRTSQHKNYTINEAKIGRDKLYAEVALNASAKPDNTISSVAPNPEITLRSLGFIDVLTGDIGVRFSQIGGMGRLKNWLRTRGQVFNGNVVE